MQAILMQTMLTQTRTGRPRPARPIRALPFLCMLLIMLLGLAACGDDSPAVDKHGLELQGLSSAPVGEPVAVQFGLAPGARWAGDLVLEVSNQRKVIRKGRSEPSQNKLTMTLAVEEQADADNPDERSARFHYLNVEGASEGEHKGASDATYRISASGALMPGTLLIVGKNVAQSRTLIDSMLLAGFGGSASWLPRRPVRVGEAWEAGEVLQSAAVAKLLRLDRQHGVRVPKPVQRGQIKVEGLRQIDGRAALDLRLDVLVEVNGAIADAASKGTMSMGWHVFGTCTIDVQTGLPRVLDLRAGHVLSAAGGGESVEERMDLRLEGRLGPAE